MPKIQNLAVGLVLVCCSAPLAHAQYTQQGNKLVGTGITGNKGPLWGWAAALSADGNTAVIGAPLDGFYGAVWIFARTNGVWSQQAGKLIGSGAIVPPAGGSQGHAVAISADGDTVLSGDDSDNGSAGAVYVFTRSNGVWQQQGQKLVGSGAIGTARQGQSLSLSADGNTAVVGGHGDNSQVGAAWVFTRSGGVWTQQGGKLVGNGATGVAQQGQSAAISGDGNTILVGGFTDNSFAGAAWVFTRNNGVWTQQGNKLAGTGAIGGAGQGWSVALSHSGNTAVVGGRSDNGERGAAWIFTRSNGIWTQDGPKLVGTGAVGAALQAQSIAMSGDGNTVISGGDYDNGGVGAAWTFTRTNGVWTQQGNKLVGSGAAGPSHQGYAVALSADASTAMVGGYGDQPSGAAWPFTAPQPPRLRFVPVTPCRLVDTRTAYAGGRTGGFGPPVLAAGSTRTVPIPSSTTCAVPPTAKAYVFNVTLDTIENGTGPVDFVTVYPTGETRPDFWTARTTTGGYIANAAIVTAGANGSVDVYTSSHVNFILDINGYFTDDPSTPGLLYYPIQPCRAVDTRGPVYSALPAPYGNSRLQARETRTLRIPGSPGCQIPAAAAYSTQLTLAPGELTNGSPVAFLTAWPAGLAQPNISNMNSVFGYAVANSGIIPASADGSINVFAFDSTNLILDVNGYFAPDDGTGRGLSYFPTTQCRVMNTMDVTQTGPYGGPALSAGVDRTLPVAAGRCSGLPTTAKAWAANATVVPGANPVPYLSAWPSGTPWPNISQLNAFQGQTVSNSSIVPASADGSIDIRVAGTTQVALEIAGYFSR